MAVCCFALATDQHTCTQECGEAEEDGGRGGGGRRGGEDTLILLCHDLSFYGNIKSRQTQLRVCVSVCHSVWGCERMCVCVWESASRPDRPEQGLRNWKEGFNNLIKQFDIYF